MTTLPDKIPTEYRADVSRAVEISRRIAPVMTEAGRRWVELEDIDIEEGDFDRLGADFEAQTGNVRAGRVAQAEARLFPQRDTVDFAVGWIGQHRT